MVSDISFSISRGNSGSGPVAVQFSLVDRKHPIIGREISVNELEHDLLSVLANHNLSVAFDTSV
jgi:hypothetical protein